MTPRIWTWVWTIPQCEGGNLDAIVARAQTTGVGLIVKVADGLSTAGAWDPQGRAYDLLARCKAAGVPVRSWSYVYPTVDLQGQAEVATRSGYDHIFDAEVEWDGHAAEARLFVDDLLARRNGQMLGYAPLPIVSYHDAAGQYQEFNRLDLACPQAYAGTGGRSALGALQWTEQEWDTAFPGCKIEPALYAADQDPADLRSAISYCFGKLVTHDRAFGDGAVSVWSYQHMTQEHWDVVTEFKEGNMAFVTGDQVKELIREMLLAPEGANLVSQAIANKYGPALEAELTDTFAKLAASDAVSDQVAVRQAVSTAVRVVFNALTPHPPFAGGQYAGESSDGSTVLWYDPATKVNRFFVNGLETGSAPNTP